MTEPPTNLLVWEKFTPLKMSLFGTAFFFGLGAFSSFFPTDRNVPFHRNDVLILGLALLSGLFFVLFWLLEDCIVLDQTQRRCFFRRRFRQWVKTTPLFDFADVIAVGVQGKFENGRLPWYWAYTPVALTRQGDLHTLGERSIDSEGFLQTEARARQLADLMDAPLFPAEEKRILIRRGLELAYVKNERASTRRMCGLIGIGTVFVVGICYYLCTH